MHPKAFDSDGVQFAFDQTSIHIAEECLCKYHYSMLEGWRHPAKSVHLLFGGWYASALESFHQYLAKGMGWDEALEEVVAEALVETWEYPECESCDGTGELRFYESTGGPLIEQKTACGSCAGEGKLREGGTPWQSLHNTKTRENLIRTIVWYTEQYIDDPCKTLILSNGKAAVEHSFAIDVDNGLVFAGHLDRCVEYAGSPYVQDQKTTGTTISSRYFDNFSPDTQMSMYSWAGKIIWNTPVKGVMIDAVQIAVGFSRFERGFAFRSSAQLDEWYDHSMHHIEAARKATRENYFPMNRSACGSYGGCEYRTVCSRSPEVRENFLKAEFVRGPRWDPLQARG